MSAVPAISISPVPARIESARELFEALASPDLRLRIAVIGALAKDPRGGLLIGKHEGKDLIDAIIATVAAEPGGSALGKPLLQVLTAFVDPRVEALFAQGLETWAEFPQLEVAAGYLARTEGGKALVRAELLRVDRPLQAQAAARGLVAAGVELSLGERLRVALLEGQRTVPPVTVESLPFWLAELAGPLRRRAVAKLRTETGAGLRLLAGAWDALSSEARVALFGAVRESLSDSEGLAAATVIIPLALAGDDDELILAAFACLAALGTAADSLRPLLSSYVARSNPAVLAAALTVAQADVDVRGLYRSATDVYVRGAALRRLARDQPSDSMDLLITALADSEWAIRAVAAQLLNQFLAGKTASVEPMRVPMRDAIRPLAAHSDPAVRLAAAQVLASFSDAPAQGL